MAGFISPLHCMPLWLAQRQLYLCFIICFSLRMASDWTGTLYRVMCFLYICSENKASLVSVGTVAVVITTGFDCGNFVNNLNRAVKCQVRMSLCKFSCGWSKRADVSMSWFCLSHPPVVYTLDNRVHLQYDFFFVCMVMLSGPQGQHLKLRGIIHAS